MLSSQESLDSEKPAALVSYDKTAQIGCSRSIQIGGISIRISGERPCDLLFGPMLERFCVNTTLSNLDLRVEWVKQLPNTNARVLFDSGVLWSVYELDGGLQFD